MAKQVMNNDGNVFLAWESSDELTPEVKFLMEKNRLKLNYENPAEFFQAKIGEKFICATSFAVLIFNNVSYDEEGKVTDAEFNIVTSVEFVKNYHYCD